METSRGQLAIRRTDAYREVVNRDVAWCISPGGDPERVVGGGRRRWPGFGRSHRVTDREDRAASRGLRDILPCVYSAKIEF